MLVPAVGRLGVCSAVATDWSALERLPSPFNHYPLSDDRVGWGENVDWYPCKKDHPMYKVIKILLC